MRTTPPFTQPTKINTMDTIIIDGKQTARSVLQRLSAQIGQLKQSGHTPGLAVVLVGEDPASRVYVNSKVKACEDWCSSSAS